MVAAGADAALGKLDLKYLRRILNNPGVILKDT
jgi:hypothetical protein